MIEQSESTTDKDWLLRLKDALSDYLKKVTKHKGFYIYKDNRESYRERIRIKEWRNRLRLENIQTRTRLISLNKYKNKHKIDFNPVEKD